MNMIPFNKPFLSGNELKYIEEAVASGKISGDGIFTRRCQQLLEQKYGFPKVLLTSSCTDALEMAAILGRIGPGDEVIMPSFTFVSTANPFVMRGASLAFADTLPDHPCLDPRSLEKLISPKTRAIVVMHYGGVACDMDPIMELAARHGLLVVEDAAHAIDSFYKGKPLGGIGQLGAFSFHETKNVIAGEGGALVLSPGEFFERGEIIREKGTNRSQFFRGEVDKYNWVDIGSSFLPSEITAAFLFAQLENIDRIQFKRKLLWDRYREGLGALEKKEFISLPVLPSYASGNAHLFYLTTRSETERSDLIRYLGDQGVLAIFHYQPLHLSPYFLEHHAASSLPNTQRFAGTLLRLPMYFELEPGQVDFIVDQVNCFYARR
jgi:dTDP-4-amino-4,6-dideoxygalactose transaminase